MCEAHELASQVGQDKSVHEAHKVYDAKHGTYSNKALSTSAGASQTPAKSTVNPFGSLK